MAIELGPSVLELYDISTLPLRKGKNEIAVASKTGGTIRVSGDVVVDPLGLDGDVKIDALLLQRFWPLLRPYFEFDIEEGSAAGSLHYSVQLQEDGLHARVSDVDYRLNGLAIKTRGEEVQVLDVGAVTVAGGYLAWPEGDVGASEIRVEGPRAFAWLEPDGSFGWVPLLPKPTQQQVVETYREVEKATTWKAQVGRVVLVDASATLEDRTFDPPVSFGVEDADVTLTDISTEKGSRWGLDAGVALLGGATASAQGQVGVTPLAAEVAVALTDLELARLQPYVARFVPLELRSGSVTAKGDVAVESGEEGPRAAFRGQADVARLEVGETAVGSRLLRWDAVEVRGIEAAQRPPALAIETIDVRGAGVDVVVSEEGQVNLIELLAAATATPSGAGAAATEGAAGTGLPSVRVGLITLRGCSGAYTDRTVAPPFTLGLDALDGTVKNVASHSTAGAAVEIDGKVRSGGGLGVDGEIDLLDPAHLTDLSIQARQVDLPPLSPLLVRYVGHPALGGRADVGLDYEIVASELKGDNRLVTQDFKLGAKVAGEGMLDLPIKLGLSLLTDKNGRMTLEVPIEGNVDDPDFGVGNAVRSAIKEVTGQLIKSPFRLLGKLGGGKEGADYRYVEFEAGSAELRPNAVEKLSALAAGADQRPGLILQVAGIWDETVDAPALQKARVDALLAERAEADAAAGAAGAEGATPLDTMLALAAEQLPEAKIAALREQCTTAGQDGGPPTLDETKYRRALREALVAAQTVEPAALASLAGARAESIRALIVDRLGVDPGRVQLPEPKAVGKPAEDRWVRLELELVARD